MPSPVKFEDKGGVVGEGMDIKLIGIVGSYVYFKDVAVSEQTKRPKMIFEENTGLSLIWSTKFLQDIIQSSDFKKQIEAIRKKLPSKTEGQA